MATGNDRAMTRSDEEIFAIETRVRTVGRVRLQKRIVEEEVDVRVTLRREELVVFEEEIPDDGSPGEPGPMTVAEDTLEIVLHAEEPVIGTRVVLRERVRARIEVVTEEVPVATELRREVVDLEHDEPAW